MCAFLLYDSDSRGVRTIEAYIHATHTIKRCACIGAVLDTNVGARLFLPPFRRAQEKRYCRTTRARCA